MAECCTLLLEPTKKYVFLDLYSNARSLHHIYSWSIFFFSLASAQYVSQYVQTRTECNQSFFTHAVASGGLHDASFHLYYRNTNL